MLPDLVSLALFLRTVDSGSLSKAAEQSFIALSAASRRITLLEDQLNVKLLTRTSRGVEPTPAGEALTFHARIMLRQADHLNANLSDYAKGLRGIVRLFSNTSALTQYLPHKLATFSTSCPDIKVEVQERLSSEIIRSVKDGLADVGVIFTSKPVIEGLRCYPYQIDHLVAVMPAALKPDTSHITFSALLDHDLVVLESNTAMLGLLEESAITEGKPLRLRAQVKSFEAIYKMIEAGLGVGILPMVAAKMFAGELGLSLTPLSDAWAERQMYICVRDEELPLSVQRLADHLLTNAITAQVQPDVLNSIEPQ